MTREHGVDRVKAVAIACVVGIHALALDDARKDVVGLMMPRLLEWAVPAFFFAAGYLRARVTPYPRGELRRWVRRLLPAYLIASFLAFLFRWVVMAEPIVAARLPVELVTGSAWGIYYFVPLFLGALAFSVPLARFPRAVPWLTVLSVAALIVTRIHVGKDPFGQLYGFWGIVRSPFFWWGYFVVGWFVKQHVADRWSRRRIFLISATVATVSILVTLAGQPGYTRAACRVAAAIGITMSLLFASERPVGRIGATLSEFSYEIYLFHIFVIVIARRWGYVGTSISAVPAVWLAAVLGGLAVGVPISRAVQIPRSGDAGA